MAFEAFRMYERFDFFNVGKTMVPSICSQNAGSTVRYREISSSRERLDSLRNLVCESATLFLSLSAFGDFPTYMCLEQPARLALGDITNVNCPFVSRAGRVSPKSPSVLRAPASPNKQNLKTLFFSLMEKDSLMVVAYISHIPRKFISSLSSSLPHFDPFLVAFEEIPRKTRDASLSRPRLKPRLA